MPQDQDPESFLPQLLCDSQSPNVSMSSSPEPVNITSYGKRHSAEQLGKDFEMGRFSWITQWALQVRGRQRETGQQNRDAVPLPLRAEEASG